MNVSTSNQGYHNKLTDEKRRDYLNKIQRQIRHLTDLIDNVLLVGKAEVMGISFAPSTINLELFCQNIVDEIQTISNQHQIVMITIGATTSHSVDTRLLRQMLVNLLSNAIKYSPKGGEIRFELSCLENEAIFLVKDNGIGIPESDLGRLFEAFHCAENVDFISGTGLGLAIVKLAAERHTREQ